MMEKRLVLLRWWKRIVAHVWIKRVLLCLLGLVGLLLLLSWIQAWSFQARLQQHELPDIEQIAGLVTIPSHRAATVVRQRPSPTLTVSATTLLPSVYGVVGAYRSQRVDIQMGDLYDYWRGLKPSQSPPFYHKIYLLPDVQDDLCRLWHVKASHQFVAVLPNAQALLAKVRQDPASIGILPLDQVRVGVQLFTVDRHDPLRPAAADFSDYPLAIYHQAGDRGRFTTSVDRLSWVTLSGDTVLWPELAQKITGRWPDVTALVKHVSGSDPFAKADDGLVVLHNTLPFLASWRPAGNQPDSVLQRLAAPLVYTQTLAALHPAAVDLSGGHSLDYGPGGLLFTLQQYQALHWHPFGVVLPAGASEALQTVSLTKRDNRVVFIGVNATSSPVAKRFPRTFAHDVLLDLPQLGQQIAQLHRQTPSALIFVLVHGPEQEKPVASGAQVALFRRLMAQGADVVAGVQGDVPQNAALSADGERVTFYGLGHLWAQPEPDQKKGDHSLWRRSWVVQFFLYDHHLIAFRLYSAVQEPKTGYLFWAQDDTPVAAGGSSYSGDDQPAMSLLWSTFVRTLVIPGSR